MLYNVNELFSGAIAADGTRTGQAITATATSTNVGDLRAGSKVGGPALVNAGLLGTPLYLIVRVGAAFNNLTSLTITLESSAASDLSSSTVHFSSGAILLAALTANKQLLVVPLPVADYKRYLGLRYTVAGTNPSTGDVTAFLSMDAGGVSPVYPSGFTLDA